MMRLFTLATISSMIAARRGRPTAPAARHNAAAASMKRARDRADTRRERGRTGTACVMRGLLALEFADVAERQQGAVHTDFGFLLQVGEIAFHHLVRLLP